MHAGTIEQTADRCFSMTFRPHIVGAILAGGGSRRMFAAEPQGGDKTLLDLGGQPMLAHVIGRFRPQVSRLVLNANSDRARFASFGLEVIADDNVALGGAEPVTGRGPLGGLLAAMAWARTANEPDGTGALALATVSSDTPFLPQDLVRQLCAHAGREARPAIAVSAGRRHPTIAVWPLGLADDLAETLARGKFGVDRFATRHGAIEVSFPMRDIGGIEVDPFFNANTPEDLARARAMLKMADFARALNAHRDKGG